MLSGKADPSVLVAGAPRVEQPATEPWDLGPVIVVTATVELAGAREVLFPPALHPTVPVLARIEAVEVPGLARWVRIGLSCRSGLRPRQLLAGGFAEGDADALGRLRAGWAWPTGHADISIRPGYDATTVVVRSGGQAVLDVVLADPRPLAADDVQWFSALHPAHLPQGPRLVQVDVSAAVQRAERSRVQVRTFAAPAWGDPRLHLVWPLAGTVVRADLTLGRVRFLNRVDVWAFDGTERVA